MSPLAIGPTSPAVTAVITSSMQHHAGRDVAAHDQGLAQTVPAERHQVALGGALADRGGLLEDGVRRRRAAAAEQCLERRRQQEVAVRRAVEAVLVDQPLTAGDPAAGARRLATEDAGPSTARTRTERPAPGRPRGGARGGPARRRRRCRRPGRRGGAAIASSSRSAGVERRLVGRRGQVVGRARPRLPSEGVTSPVERAGRGPRLPFRKVGAFLLWREGRPASRCRPAGRTGDGRTQRGRHAACPAGSPGRRRGLGDQLRQVQGAAARGRSRVRPVRVLRGGLRRGGRLHGAACCRGGRGSAHRQRPALVLPR